MDHYTKNKYFSNVTAYINYSKIVSSFKICSINVRSISSIDKFNKFKTIIAKLPCLPNIISIQETWISLDLVQLYNIPGYKSIHCCRADGYGGVSIFIHENLKFSVDFCESNNFIDTIVVTINDLKIKGKPVKFMAFYRSQKCRKETFLLSLESFLNSYGRYPCISAGDSNIDVLHGNSSEELLNLITNYSFENCHTMLTRPVSGTSIDHVYSNIFHSLSISSVEHNISDHNIIFCQVEVEMKTRNEGAEIIIVQDYKRLKSMISNNLPVMSQTGDPAVDTENLISYVNYALENSTYEKRRNKVLKKEIAPWINGNLYNLIKYKQSLLKKRRKNRENLEINENLKRISKIIRKASKDSLNNFYINRINLIQHDPKKCWKFLNETLGKNKSKKIYLKDQTGN